MQKLLALVALSAALLVAAPAQASERYIGKIVSGAGANTTNVSTAAPFVVPQVQKITIWCDAAAFIAVDTLTASSSTSGALPVVAQEKFPTSTNSSGGAFPVTVYIGTAASALIQISGPGAFTCYVSVRTGNE